MITFNRRITEVRNDSGSPGLFFDQVLAVGEVWEIADRKLTMWRDDPTISGAIISGTLAVGDGTQFFSDPLDGEQYFYDNPRPLRPTTVDLENQTLLTLSSGIDDLGGIDYTIGSLALVGEGTVQVASGTNTITISGSPTGATVVDSIIVSGTSFEGDVEFQGKGSVSLHPDEPSEGIITISGAESSNVNKPGQLEGQVVQIEFTSGSADEWMSLSSEDHNSDQHPYTFPFPARIVAAMYTNEKSDTRFELEFHKALAGDGANNVLEHTWTVGAADECRVAYNTELFDEDISFAAGDKLAMFLAKNGGIEPAQAVIALYVQITADEPRAIVTENFAGDFTT